MFYKFHYRSLFLCIYINNCRRQKYYSITFLKGLNKINKMSWPLLFSCRFILIYHFILHKGDFQMACDFSILIHLFFRKHKENWFTYFEFYYVIFYLSYSILSYPIKRLPQIINFDCFPCTMLSTVCNMYI